MYPGFYGSLWKICGVIFLDVPDFIAYKLTDLPKLTVTLLRISTGTTIRSVGHLRTKTLSRGNRNTISRF